MSWTNYFDKILVLNLRKRTDRLMEVYSEMEQYNIPFELVTAIENEQQGAEGLKETMQLIFEDAIKHNFQRILVFEDDVEWVRDPNPIMEEVVKQFPDNFHLIFLGH